ncbi:MAG TPA: helix-turn-helix domain-containing protein [Solirubrobacterales bacterium]|jgi:hypothetical protein
MSEPSLSKRQREVLERLEQGMSAKEIATDIGVSRNAVYQHIERLRNAGVLPETYTPSGQPPRSLPAPRLDLGRAVPAPGFGPGPRPGSGPAGATVTPSALTSLRRPAGKQLPEAEYAKAIEKAIADGDVAALAYELGRLDATEPVELVTAMVESALERLGVLDRSRAGG